MVNWVILAIAAIIAAAFAGLTLYVVGIACIAGAIAVYFERTENEP